jgi:hypothetical protein
MVTSVPISAIMTAAPVLALLGISSSRSANWPKGGDHLLYPPVQLSDVGVDSVDPGEHLGDQERVMIGELAGERLFQRGDLGASGVYEPGRIICRSATLHNHRHLAYLLRTNHSVA